MESLNKINFGEKLFPLTKIFKRVEKYNEHYLFPNNQKKKENHKQNVGKSLNGTINKLIDLQSVSWHLTNNWTAFY